MIPLASASGPAIIGVVVVGAGLFLWWLLHEEARDEPEEGAPGDNGEAPRHGDH